MSEQLEEQSRALLEDYLLRCRGDERPLPVPPAADDLWRVAQEVHLGNSAFFKSCEELDVDPGTLLQRVAREVALEGGLNWGRVLVLIVFSGTLVQRRRRAGTPREVAGVLSHYLLGEQSDWFQKNGGWAGFQKFCSKKGTHQGQESSHFSNALMAAAGVGLAGLVFLLAVR